MLSKSTEQTIKKWRNDRHRERNICNCVKKREKNSGFQRGLNPSPRDSRCDVLPIELWSHWRWEQVNCGFICSRENAFTATIISSFHFISAVHVWFISYITQTIRSRKTAFLKRNAANQFSQVNGKYPWSHGTDWSLPFSLSVIQKLSMQQQLTSSMYYRVISQESSGRRVIQDTINLGFVVREDVQGQWFVPTATEK